MDRAKPVNADPCEAHHLSLHVICLTACQHNSVPKSLACLPGSGHPQVNLVVFQHVGNERVRETTTVTLRAGQHFEQVFDHTANGVHGVWKAAKTLPPVGQDVERCAVD